MNADFWFELTPRSADDRYYLYYGGKPVLNPQTGKPQFYFMVNVKLAAEALHSKEFTPAMAATVRRVPCREQ